MNDAINQSIVLEENNLVSIGWTREKPMFEESPLSEDDLESINRFAPGRLDSSQVYARSMYLCSSQPCASDGCQFTRSALNEIAARVPGLSVLTGHDRSSLPLARFYKATVVQQGNSKPGEPVYFVRAWFYWLRATSSAQDLLLNIDGGIYREASLAWRYDSWRCSICHTANGACGHRVGSLYDGKPCFRLIDRITDVLEGSLVYKSADRNTYLAGARSGENKMEDAPLLLIGAPNDPIFVLLERADAVQSLGDFETLEGTLAQSVESLWIRANSAAFCERTAQKLLIEKGACAAEILSSQTDNHSIWGQNLRFVGSDGAAMRIEPASFEEDHHGAIWTV